MDSKDRLMLATLGAHGILAHNTAVSMPGEFTEKTLQERSGIGFGESPYILERLENQGYARSRDTGYYGYGDHYVPGVITWQITAAGLVALWTGA